MSFHLNPRAETLIRVILTIVVIINAVIPTAALALPANSGSTESQVDSVGHSLSVTEQTYSPPEAVMPDLGQFSPLADEKGPETPEKDPVEFSISASKGEVDNRRTVTINVSIRNNSKWQVDNLTYYDKLEEGLQFESSTDKVVEHNEKTGTITYFIQSIEAGEQVDFSYTLNVENTKTGKLSIHNAEIEYDLNGETLAQTASLGFADGSTLVGAESLILVPDQAGDGWESAGRYSLYLGEEVLSQEAVVTITPADIPGNSPDLQFNLDLIQTTVPATSLGGELSEQVINLTKPIETDFDKPAYLEINLDGYFDLENIPAGQEPYVATYDDLLDIWVKIPILETNSVENTVTVEAAHFSTWGAGLGSSLPQNGANVLLFDQPYTSLFTGSSRYSIPIWTPPGRGGMAPDVSLSYSSATVDGVLGDVQAPWTGVGWSIDGIEIVRKITTNTNGYGYENDFALTLNGALYELERDVTDPSAKRYHTNHDAFLYIERHNYALHNQKIGEFDPNNTTGEWWEVVTTDGTRYRLGWNDKSEQLALMYGYKCTTGGNDCSTPDQPYSLLGYAGIAQNLVALRWRVDRVTNTHGNYIEYNYHEEHALGQNAVAQYDRGSYVEDILYTGFDSSDGTSHLEPGYKIHFVNTSRSTVGDIPNTFNVWDNADFQLLDKIEISCPGCSNTNVVRTYDFGYSLATVPNANGTLTLTSVAVMGKNGVLETNAPTIRFTYQNKDNRAVTGGNNKYTYPRLTSINNGAGGVLSYIYENDGRGTNSWYNYRVKEAHLQSGLETAALQSYTYDTAIYTGLGSLGELIGYTTTTENQLDYNAGNSTILSTKHTFGTSGLDTGRELKTEWLDGSTVLRKVTNTYVTDNSEAPYSGWNFRYLYSTHRYEGNTLTSKVFYLKDPGTGNLLSQIEYLGSAVYRKTYYEYWTGGSSKYILDKVSRTYLVDSSNNPFGDIRLFYNSEGDVTITEQLTGVGNATVDSKVDYDEYGNTNTVYAPLDGTVDGNYGGFESDIISSTVYDDTLHTFPIEAKNALNQITTTSYIYELALPASVTDPNNWTASTTYDGLGRTLSVKAPGLSQPGVYYNYPVVNNGYLYPPYAVEMQILDKSITPNKYRSVWGIYDGLGRMLQTQVYDGDRNEILVADSEFNAQGLVYRQSLPYYSPQSGGYYISPAGTQFTTSTFDKLGRMLTSTQPGGIVTTTSYDGLSVTVADPNQNTVTRASDGLGRLVSVKEYSDATTLYATTSYGYDPGDRLKTVLDAQGNVTTIDYDWLGRKSGMDDPDMGVWAYQYYPSGNLKNQTDARGQVLNFTYDDLNRPLTKAGNGINVSYQYGTTAGSIGMRTTMTDGSGSTTWSYDNYGRSVTEIKTIGGAAQSLTTTTDWLGRPLTVAYPGNETLTYKYDALGRPDQLSSSLNPGVSLVDLAYTTLGQIATQTLGNGVIVTNTYDSANRLDARTAAKAGTSLLNFNYDYDAAGNITQIVDGLLGETHTYEYDFLNRLTSAEAVEGANYAYRQQFEYDKVGNILQMNDWAVTPQAYREPEPYVDAPALYRAPADPQVVSDSLIPPAYQGEDTATPTPTNTPSQTPTATLIPTNTPAAATPTPTFDGNVHTLLHMEGLDGSDNFVDESGKIWSTVGNAQIDIEQSKFGDASALFDGTGDYISADDNSDFSFGSGNFTIDFWVRFNALPANNSYAMLYEHLTNGSNYNYIYYKNNYGGSTGLTVVMKNAGTQIFSTTANWTASTNTWYHVAIVRDGNVGKIYINGVEQGSATVSGSLPDPTGKVYIGYNYFNSGYGLNGWLDEYRISKGIARWTSNFTPPSAPYGGVYTPTVIPSNTPTPATFTATSSPTATQEFGNLSAYWNFESVTGTTAPDAAPNDVTNNPATLSTGVTIENISAQGKGAYFDGSASSYAEVGDHAEIENNGSFTLSAWINPSAIVTTGDQYIVRKSGDYGFITVSTLAGTATPTPNPNVLANGRLVFEIPDLSPSTLDGPILPVNTWSLVTGVYDASANEMRLYLNGEMIASQSVTGTVSMAANALYFSPTSNPYKGSLDEVKFFKGVLSSSQIANLYSASVPTLTPTPTLGAGSTATPTLSPTPTITATPLPASAQQWGLGNDGDLIIDGSSHAGYTFIGTTFNINTNTNGYLGRTCADGVAYSVTQLGSTAAALDVSPAAGCLNVNDEVMLIQLTDSAWNKYNSGSYEFLRVASVTGSQVAFTTSKTKWYGNSWHSDSNIGTGSGQYRVMLMRVPNYHDVTVTGTLTASAFNGNKYGMVVFRVNGVLSGAGTINANGLGFGGSAGYGKGGNALIQDRDGGGGGYGTNGTAATNSGGSAGGTYAFPQINSLFFGSGGGASGPRVINCPDACEEVHPGAGGGRGGGIVLISSDTINFTGTLSSNGATGGYVNVNNGELYGGAGSGGSIRLESRTITTLTTVNANGGVGGGDAGDGGKGRIAVYYQTSQSIQTVSPSAYIALLGQAPTPTPAPTSINLTSTPSPWGNGKDGNLTVASGVTFNLSTQNSGVHNCVGAGDGAGYSIATLSDSWAKLTTTPGLNCLNPGDEIILLHTSGSSPNKGNYELLRVGGVVGDTVYFTGSKTKYYGTNAGDDSNVGGSQAVILQRVPNYASVEVIGTLKATNRLIFRVSGSLTGTGTISTNGGGFGSAAGYAYGGTGTTNKDGGGGGYGTSGTAAANSGGSAGGTYGLLELGTLFYGSGGGASGIRNNGVDTFPAQPGGPGGGIVLIIGNTINFTGPITSNGNPGADANGVFGGGGSGGSIRLEGNTITLGTNVTVNGATGNGDAGDGGKGRIAVYYVSSLSSSLTAGSYIHLQQYNFNATPTPTPLATATPGVDSNVKSILHMDGTDASTSFVDYAGKIWTANGNAQIDTGQSKFGGASALFDGTGDYIDTPDHADFDLGSGDFTIDTWFKKNANNATYAITGQTNSTGTSTSTSFVLYANGDSTGNHPKGIIYYNGSSSKSITSSTAVTDTNWHHLALVRSGATMTLYLDGTSVGTTSVSGVTVNNSSNKVSVGRSGENATQYMNGWVDELRFSKGVARWTSNFTPPSQAYYGNYVAPTPTTPPTGWQEYDYAYSETIPHAVTSVVRPTVTDTYEYDANGNMTCRVENGLSYKQDYNTENRISGIHKMNGTCTTGTVNESWLFAYDGDGVRTTTAHDVGGNISTTRYFFGGSYETRSDGTTLKYYSFGGQTILRDSGGLKYMLSDHLGSIVAVTDASGTLISEQRYLPFGQVRTDIGSITQTDFRYTGQRQLDEGMGGLMDYKARFYSPYLNRFIQPDTVIPGAANPQNWNRFSYVGNNPIGYSDPTGHMRINDGDGGCYPCTQLPPPIPDPDEDDDGGGISGGGKFGKNPEHDYETDIVACPAWVGCTEEEMKEYMTHFQYPGQWPWSPVTPGDDYIVAPARIWDIPVPAFYLFGLEGLGAITVNSKNNKSTLINVSQTTHIFNEGVVERRLYQTENGAWRIATHGYGTNVRFSEPWINDAIDVINDKVGKPVFIAVDLQMITWIAADQLIDAISK